MAYFCLKTRDSYSQYRKPAKGLISIKDLQKYSENGIPLLEHLPKFERTFIGLSSLWRFSVYRRP